MDQHHQLFLKWLIMAVLVVFGVSAAFYFGLIQTIVSSDISLISVLIMALFAVMFIYLGYRTSQLSKELNLAYQVRDIIRSYDIDKLKYEIKDEKVYVCDKELPDCALTKHIKNLIRKARVSGTLRINQMILLEEFSDTLHENSALGWMVSQKMINLGLLGTAIGFAVALTALFGISSFDFAAMKTILADVSIGMSIALYTTITALATSIPLEIKSHFIEQGSNQLTSIVTKITEVYVLPVLERENAEKSSKE